MNELGGLLVAEETVDSYRGYGGSSEEAIRYIVGVEAVVAAALDQRDGFAVGRERKGGRERKRRTVHGGNGRELGSGSGEGGQVACRHQADEEYTYLPDVSHGYSTARRDRSVHPHRFTYQPTYLPTYQPTHQPTGSVSSPPIGDPK